MEKVDEEYKHQIGRIVETLKKIEEWNEKKMLEMRDIDMKCSNLKAEEKKLLDEIESYFEKVLRLVAVRKRELINSIQNIFIAKNKYLEHTHSQLQAHQSSIQTSVLQTRFLIENKNEARILGCHPLLQSLHTRLNTFHNPILARDENLEVKFVNVDAQALIARLGEIEDSSLSSQDVEVVDKVKNGKTSYQKKK